MQRKGKRFALAGDTNGTSGTREQKIEVCIICKEQLPKQFKLAKLLRAEKIQNVVRVKYINSYKVLIQFDKEESAEELLNSKYFNEMGYNTYKTMEINRVYGVIKDIDLDRSDEEILESLYSTTKILGIKRLKRKNNYDGRWEMSEAMRICFQGSSLPTQIKMFDTSVRVTPYVFPVTQCSRCWRYGHINKICPSHKTVCPKCGENHQNCDRTSFRCNNCGGNHMAMAKICPIYIKEKRIRELMTEFSCTYKRALTIYVPPSPPPLPVIVEKSFPTITNDQVITTNVPIEVEAFIEESISPKSYAEATKESHKKSKRKSTSNTSTSKSVKATKQKVTENVNLQIRENTDFLSEPESSVNEEELEKQHEEEDKSKNNEHDKWRVLFQKLREKVVDNTLKWEEKLNSCIKILYKYLLTFVFKYIINWPCFKLFTEYGSEK